MKLTDMIVFLCPAKNRKCLIVPWFGILCWKGALNAVQLSWKGVAKIDLFIFLTEQFLTVYTLSVICKN